MINKPLTPQLHKHSVMPLCLRMSLKSKWFDMTKAGVKTEDYREINSYWIKRLTSDFSWDMTKYPLKLNEHKEVINKYRTYFKTRT